MTDMFEKVQQAIYEGLPTGSVTLSDCEAAARSAILTVASPEIRLQAVQGILTTFEVYTDKKGVVGLREARRPKYDSPFLDGGWTLEGEIVVPVMRKPKYTRS